MQSVPREWLDFLRQQFPKDSRIQLTEITLMVAAGVWGMRRVMAVGTPETKGCV